MSVSPTFGPRHTAALRDRMSQDGRSPLWGYRCAVLSVTLLVALIAAYILASRVNDAEARGDLARRARHRRRDALHWPLPQGLSMARARSSRWVHRPARLALSALVIALLTGAASGERKMHVQELEALKQKLQ